MRTRRALVGSAVFDTGIGLIALTFRANKVIVAQLENLIQTSIVVWIHAPKFVNSELFHISKIAFFSDFTYLRGR